MRNLLKAILLILDEVIVVAVVLLILWKLGVHLSPLVITTAVILIGILIFLIYRVISSTNRLEATGGKQGMLGLTGSAVTPLDPEGLVRAHGELWKAECTGDSIAPREEVIVIGIERLKLIVKRKDYNGQRERKCEDAKI